MALLAFSYITENDVIANFDCGIQVLNDYLTHYAWMNQTRKLGVTMLARLEDNIVGYYTVCPAHIETEELPKKIARGLPKYPITAFRLCKLAIDKRFHRKQYGKELLMDALLKCYQHAKDMGGYCVIVDAINEEAEKFYAHFGFIPLHNSPHSLFLSMKSIQNALAH